MIFEYDAVDYDGKQTGGRIEAASGEEAIELISNTAEMVTKIAPVIPELKDYVANEGVGVRINSNKLWVCVDGVCVLRVKSPLIELTDDREGML